ncbi:MAG TPA: DUF4349 domain-containing protein [Candidatus Deferrimicrobium sp.]|nr:DUF4349 domain-containing protein [Candidatus Deferrimicrobium sp.]
MDEQPRQRTILVIAGLLVGGAILASSSLLGGRASTVLSTVGSAIGGQGSGGAVTTGGSTTGSGGAGSGSTSGGTTSGTAGQVADAAAAVPTLLIVRTGELHIKVADLLTAIRDADAAVTRAGGYDGGSNRTDDAADQSAEVTYRIPSPAWDSTLGVLRGLAAKVGAEQVRTEEVTGQVVDLTARITNLRATEAALQAIMASAGARMRSPKGVEWPGGPAAVRRPAPRSRPRGSARCRDARRRVP